MESYVPVLAFTHTSKPPFKKNIYFSKKILGGMGGFPHPPTGKLGDFEKGSYIYNHNKALFENIFLRNTTARPAKVRI
jgi:hypothetical protein